jgi:hypothetical protein
VLETYFGPFGNTQAIYWAAAYTSFLPATRQFFDVVERNNCFITISNTSSKNRRVVGDMILPQLIHQMNQQLVLCSIIATQWYEIYTTAVGPTGIWSQFGFTLQNFPHYASPTTYTMVLGGNFPFTNHGDGQPIPPNGFPAWTSPTNGPGFLATGIGAAYNKSEHMGNMPYDTGVIAPGQSIRIALAIAAVSPADPLFIFGGLPDVPFLVGYTQLTTNPKVSGVLI